MITNIGEEEAVEIATKGVTYTIQMSEPHNFYKIKVSKGMVPKALKGSYTMLIQAETAVKRYIAEQKKDELKKD